MRFASTSIRAIGDSDIEIVLSGTMTISNLTHTLRELPSHTQPGACEEIA